MKTQLSVNTFIFAIALSVQQNPVHAQPEITFEKTKHEFGTITAGDECTADFIFKNTGNEPLIITNCTGSGGGGVPFCPREPISPGESGIATFSYHSQGKGGPFNKAMKVYSNATPSDEPLILFISGDVIPCTDCPPAREANYTPSPGGAYCTPSRSTAITDSPALP